jgi:hypothetical protein
MRSPFRGLLYVHWASAAFQRCPVDVWNGLAKKQAQGVIWWALGPRLQGVKDMPLIYVRIPLHGGYAKSVGTCSCLQV